VLLNKYPNPASVNFCWIQGESDANKNLQEPYNEALKQRITNFCRDLKQPEMKFVIGRISASKKASDAPWEAVHQAKLLIERKKPSHNAAKRIGYGFLTSKKHPC